MLLAKPFPLLFKKKQNRKILYQVNEKDAVYPITIDPISTTPAAILESNTAGALMGSSVSSAGDVNGDGYSDVIVGAPSYTNGQTNEGAIYLFHGSANGINTVATVMIESNLANILSWLRNRNQSHPSSNLDEATRQLHIWVGLLLLQEM
ncbi:MAG: FG-GAP repeat protein [Chitinophagaceae bacterium]|nr:FG-GAP repeat protein [Chitinophagaceae bacterium]